MKSTGIVRKMDELGRIVLPKELRKTLGINEKDYVEIFTEQDQIVLKKYHPSCVFCGSVENLTMFNGKNICDACRVELCQK